MLEVCPSIAEGTPTAEIHPLSIGGKADPVRLVFTASSGSALNASVVDLGNRFRFIVNQVKVVQPEHPLPKLPVARAIWIPEPNLKIAATAWILAGGAHHTALSRALNPQHLEDSRRWLISNTADRSQHNHREFQERTKVEPRVLSLSWLTDRYGVGVEPLHNH